jgi:choline-glycine betaine transporter
MKTVVMVAKIIGIAILMITGSLLISLPINYLFYKVAGPIGKIIIIAGLFILLCLCIWYCIKGESKTDQE